MNQLLIDLKNKLNPIVELIKDKNDVFYFDYPLHLNVGDLLIYHGTEQFFKDHNINVTLKRCEYDLDLEEVKAKITPNTTILLHGGGNFGDLYPQHQKIREEMVTNFQNNRIIVLPQTAYFKHEENLQKSAALFRSHSVIAIYWLVTKERRIYLHNFQIMFICHRTWRISFMEPWKRNKAKLVSSFTSYVKILKQVISRKISSRNYLPTAM